MGIKIKTKKDIIDQQLIKKRFKISLTWDGGKTKICSVGINVDKYKKNPVVFLGHDYKKLIGKCTSFKIKKNKIKGTAKLIQNIKDKRYLKNWGIGFISKKSHIKGDKIIHDEIELLEVSVNFVND